MSDLPAGTVTLLFTDIEGSTKLLDELGAEGYRDALGEHRRLLREAFARHRGYEVDYEGDAFFVAFERAGEAVGAFIVCERAGDVTSDREPIERARVGLPRERRARRES